MSSISNKTETLFAPAALLPSGWAKNVRVVIGADGRIARVETDAAPVAGDTRLDGPLLPAVSNLHSHSFQRAMAGLSEWKSAARDDFWTWREVMYRFALNLDPEDIEAITAFVAMEMAEAGFSAFAEFHYIHHRKDGGDYDNPAETARRVIAGARVAGLGLTLLPVYYAYGGAGEKPLGAAQRRFGCDLGRYIRLHEASAAAIDEAGADFAIGVAPHSLRAVAPGDFAALAPLFADAPVHIHAAEQIREVEEVEAWLGARPVDWLFANAPVTERWCFVHATHLSAAETARLARSRAVAGLCPVTEANLGDGVFPAEAYLAEGGRFGVGGDSHIRISLNEELRALEYSQRLSLKRRNVLCEDGRSTGRVLYEGALDGGAAALGRASGRIEEGLYADLLALDPAALFAFDEGGDRLLDAWVFAGGEKGVNDLWSAGRRVVQEGRHVRRDEIAADYRRVIARLKALIG